ncbi:unnamed protein product [Ceratitis capitata]|uniref:(Mediterranean fruit fly) hypothetical protein n=1 Tax=Ceratitis capitata TaxID=7213 RepID=A0A811U8H6_CERCA|nr:unnamed protein product [Ceratitis capitata]
MKKHVYTCSVYHINVFIPCLSARPQHPVRSSIYFIYLPFRDVKTLVKCTQLNMKATNEQQLQPPPIRETYLRHTYIRKNMDKCTGSGAEACSAHDHLYVDLHGKLIEN